MPTQSYHRTWCKGCKDFTLHYTPFSLEEKKEEQCKTCNTVYTSVYLSEIPREKILEQRQRYKEYKLAKSPINTYLKAYTSGRSPFDTDFPKPEIVENDAGQRSIDEERSKINEEEYKKEKALKEERKQEALKYVKLTRNDTCLCGSGKKYKNCHLQIFSQV